MPTKPATPKQQAALGGSAGSLVVVLLWLLNDKLHLDMPQGVVVALGSIIPAATAFVVWLPRMIQRAISGALDGRAQLVVEHYVRSDQFRDVVQEVFASESKVIVDELKGLRTVVNRVDKRTKDAAA